MSKRVNDTPKKSRAQLGDPIGSKRAHRIMVTALTCNSFTELAERLGWKVQTVYALLHRNPEILEAIRLLFLIHDEVNTAREIVRWAKAIKRRVK